jgi:hypothetical protein
VLCNLSLSFGGQELDKGTVVEFIVARMLGKPKDITRTDSRHLTSGGLDDPYNLFVRNCMRTVAVYIKSLVGSVYVIAEAGETLLDNETSQLDLEVELVAIQKSINTMAIRVIIALNPVLEMESPYFPQIREVICEAVRYAPGAGFAQLLTGNHLEAILQKLKDHNTL